MVLLVTHRVENTAKKNRMIFDTFHLFPNPFLQSRGEEKFMR